MLLAEDRIDLLVDRLRGMTPADRRAILARLAPGERKRMAALLAGEPDTQRWSADLTDRITDPSALTEATRRALTRAVADNRSKSGRSLVPMAEPTPSLLDAARRWLRGQR